MVLRLRIRRDRLQIVRRDDAHAAAFHLLEEGARFHRAHEQHAFERLDVGAGGDHVHGHDHARVVAVAKRGDQVFGLRAGGTVGDFLREVVALTELLAQDTHDVLGVAVVLGEHQRLRHFRTAGEDFRKQLVAEGAHDGADLVRCHHLAVELVRVVVEILVQLLPAHLARLAVAQVHIVAGLDLAARLGHLGADAIDVVVHVHAVGDRLFVAVFHHQVLVEKAEGLLRRRGGEADQVRVKIFQHLAPQVVDGAVRFVGDDDVEGLDRDRRVIGDRLGRLEQILQPGGGDFVVLFRQLAAAQHRVQPLDGTDGHARGGVERVRRQMLDDVLLAELVVVVG